MRILLSTIGSRGDVQPLVALGLELKARGEEVRLCVPPDFREWIEGLGLPVTPIGPELKSTAKPSSGPVQFTPEQRQRMIEGTVAAQFETLAAAAQGCELMVGATALQVAAPSIADSMGVPYVFAAYCPAVLPSRLHPPPVLAQLGDRPVEGAADYSELWQQDAARWNGMWGPLLNARRAALGLGPVEDVRRHIHTDQPWLAADPTLAPWPDPTDPSVFQTGAWIVQDDRPLSRELEAFLDAGEPPIYFGFGSIRAPENLAQAMIDSARALGRRAILLRGWAELALPDEGADCLAIGEVNMRLLFPRVAAVVHHGGAGTTTAATRGGAPQVVIPQHYDQHYFAGRVRELGIGRAHPFETPSAESLTTALGQVLQSDVAARARVVAGGVREDGARVAADRLLELAARHSA
ncbi:MAG TPA: glycosyltransferase [Longimicrobiales bacterium]